MVSVVALDMSRAGLRAAQVDSAYTSKPKITKFGRVSLPADAVFDGEIVDAKAVTKALKQLWKTAHFSTRRVVFAVGNRKSIVRQVTLPTTEYEKRKDTLRFAVDGQVPIDLDDAILDFLPLRDAGNNKQDGLLVASARGGLEDTVNAVERAGLTVDTVDFAGFGLLRTLPPARGVTRAMVNVGASSTVVMIATGRTPEFVRMVPTGGDDITRALERSLGVSFADAEQEKRQRGLRGGATDSRDVDAENLIRESIANLIENVRNTLNFYINSHEQVHIEKLYLSGGGSRIEGLAAVLTRALGVPVEHVDPLAHFTVSEKAREAGLGRYAIEMAAPLGVGVGEK